MAGTRGRMETSDSDIEAWLDDYYPSAYKTAFMILGNRQDAEEAVQEAFLRVWRFRDSLGGTPSIKPWLYRVVVNSCLSRAKSAARRKEGLFAPDFDDLPSPGLDPGEAAYRSELASVISEAVGSLSEDLRTAFVLKYYSGLSEKEISVAIKRRPGTVKSRLHEARKKLSSHQKLQGLASEWLSGGNGDGEVVRGDTFGR